MATTVPSRECPICLEKFRDPVVTPCGHLACHPCIKTYARRSDDPYKATCPTCRAPFHKVSPDMTIIPKRYRVFISPPLRRVFLGDSDDSGKEAIEKLNAEVATLKARVRSLKRDKDLVMDRCEAAQSALARLTSDERAARLARDKAKKDSRVAKLKLRKLQMENGARNCRCAGEQSSRMATTSKRTSGRAALDDSSSSESESESESDSSNSSGSLGSTAQINSLGGARRIRPMPKRARLRPAAGAVSPEPNVRQSSSNATPSSSSGSSLSPMRSPRILRSSMRFGARRESRDVRNVYYVGRSSGDEADYRDEPSNMEDLHATQQFPSPVRNTQDAPFQPSVSSRGPRRSQRLRMASVSSSTNEIPSEPTIVSSS